jgi:hypothetical protein
MKMYKNIARIFKIGEEPSDTEYWAKKSFRERAIAIEFLRQTKSDKQNGNRTKRKLQRVYRVIKRKKS